LVWTTETEIGNSYFTVQRSQNGADWNDLEKVQSASIGALGFTYIVYDKNPISGVSYYRLKQTDLTGKSTYSEIKEINYTNSLADITVFPNPARGFFIVKGPYLDNEQCSLYNCIGQMIALTQVVQNNAISFSGTTQGNLFYPSIQCPCKRW
jgi:hypothetical protein